MQSSARTTHRPPEAPDTAAVGVSLAAQAALLETRAHILREALDAVDAQIRETSARLGRLRQQDTDDAPRLAPPAGWRTYAAPGAGSRGIEGTRGAHPLGSEGGCVRAPESSSGTVHRVSGALRRT
ncbi:hypothetical protein ACGF3J_31675 [Streptomyces sp. NPDC048171]|uniref:hypothetical protein n=2 Tax=unclassified Streptomyces TaxID=2593676 RepID=UPI0037122B90